MNGDINPQDLNIPFEPKVGSMGTVRLYWTTKLYFDSQDCPIELLHRPEDCNVNSSLYSSGDYSHAETRWNSLMHIFLTVSFVFFRICCVEDITVEGLMKG